MSLQTPELVSNNINFGFYSATQESCSVVDADGNIYTSLINPSTSEIYGSIQKTTSSGTTTLFLQLNSGNTLGSTTPSYPRGMCFDSSRLTLYYVVFNSNNIFKITDLINANPTKVNTLSGTVSKYFRIIIDNQNPDIFYMTTTTLLNGVYSIYTYTISTDMFSTVFNLTSPSNYGASYGLAQDFTGQYLYIGLGNGGILQGDLSSGSLILLLTLPEAAPVIGLIFNTNYTLIANTSNGYGYKITINPSTGVVTYLSYYNTDNAIIIGGLGLTVDSTLLYGISENQLFKVKGDQNNPTGYKFIYNNTVSKDFADIFKIDYPIPGITTGYKSSAYSNLDLGQIFAPGNSSIPTKYFNSSNIDLGSIFSTSPSIFYSATGTNTEYTYNGYTGVVFTYDASSVAQSITFNFPKLINILLIGGGGGGGITSRFGGGGGGGIELNTSFSVNTNEIYSVVIGQGGLGSFQYPLTYATPGTESAITNQTTLTVTKATGGGVPSLNEGSSYIYGGPAGANNSGTLDGGKGADGYFPQGNGSYLISTTLPFLDPSIYSSTIYLSGGGGAGASGFYPTITFGGGLAGKGIGGLSAYFTASPKDGEDAINTISFLGLDSGFGGGGGASGGDISDPYFLAGDGGNGAVIFWWIN